MKGRRLEIRELENSSILFFEDVTGAISHFGIAAAQALVSHHRHASANVTHVGIFDKEEASICEASGATGLRRMPLVLQPPGDKFQVFRLSAVGNIAGLAPAVVRIANRLIEAKVHIQAMDPDSYSIRGGRNYDLKGCIMGAGLGSSDFGDDAIEALDYMWNQYQADQLGDFRFYCSNFVVACYQLAEMEARGCEAHDIQVVQLDYRNVSPKTLQGFIRSSHNFCYIGNYFTPEDDERPQGFEPESAVWSPYTFKERTWHKKSKDTQSLRGIALMLENYHGISRTVDTIDDRRALLELLRGKTQDAWDEDIKNYRREALVELFRQLEWDLDNLA